MLEATRFGRVEMAESLRIGRLDFLKRRKGGGGGGVSA
jgi:hypothetical protein